MHNDTELYIRLRFRNRGIAVEPVAYLEIYRGEGPENSDKSPPTIILYPLFSIYTIYL